MYRLCVLLFHIFGAYGALLHANLGDNVTLPCFYSSSVKYLSWYRQVAGGLPQIISSFYKHSQKSNSFYDKFKDNKRFSSFTGAGFYHLNISDVQESDSAMYFCGQTTPTVTQFDSGTFLVLKKSGCRTFLQQPVSNSVELGGSVTLNCTVHAGTSDREHSVYWFKKKTGESLLGILYIHTYNSSSSQCVKAKVSGSSVQSCFYSLSKRNVSLSDAGMYYCAVAFCGEIMFGHGTNLDVGVKQNDTGPVLLWSIVAALIASLVLHIILIYVLCTMAKRTNLQSQGSHAQSAADTQSEESNDLQYVALDFKKRQSKSRRQRNTAEEEETIYSGVRMADLE